MSAQMKLRSAAIILFGGTGIFGAVSIATGNNKCYQQFVMPAMRMISPETAHKLAVKIAAWGLVPRIQYKDPSTLTTKVWNLEFSNPVGLAAGFDKHAEAMDGFLQMGFGFVEIGSITPEPQDGNPKPRVFRLTEDKAIINRYGFNSHGHQRTQQRLLHRANKLKTCKQGSTIVGINLGKNKTSPDAVSDYVKGVQCLGCLGNYLVINVSSPNTPGLRSMQSREELAKLIDMVLETRESLLCSPKPPLLVKIAPDLTEKDKKDIAVVILRKTVRKYVSCEAHISRKLLVCTKGHIDGLIVSNTTISRPDSLINKHRKETGGLSGMPLQQMSTDAVRDMYKLTQGQLPIIGVGGVNSGQSAYDKIKAGASLVQIYTALAYEGPPLVTRIKTELDELIRADGYNSVSEAVGAAHR